MSGYEVNFSHKKNFSSLLAKKNLASDAADASITLSKTSPGKTVYARIRPYRIVGNKVYYGSWSKTVSTVMK